MTINPTKLANPDDLVFYVKYHIKPDCTEEFQKRLFALVDHMRREPAFVSAFVHQDAEDPTKFSMYERWTESSKEDFMTYQMAAKPYREAYEKRLPEMSSTPRLIHILRPLAFWANPKFEPVENDLIFYMNFQIKPHRQADWKEAALHVLDGMAREGAFVCAFLHQDAEDSSRFTVYERWSKPGRINFSDEHRKLLESILPDAVLSFRTFRILNPLGNWVSV
ncbi:hypothetical protein EO244_09540 [Ancylomarina salipaludis]|uniref:ABM domain-containing protein n=1 Tax=Ancylomarina salipaludis TaxID=2501299 RepID=A0A4Q1JMH3_9BACT|nr:antibiotic biosynthesis monooxygenase [Ancylomarina salipaludis]RXQ94514.1 hypothetical protein EO244_09540 [Ancylomarina salipaludis]